MKKFISLGLSVLFLVGMLSAPVLADDTMNGYQHL